MPRTESPFWKDRDKLRMFAALLTATGILIGWNYFGQPQHFFGGPAPEIEPGGSSAWNSHYYVFAANLLFLAATCIVIFAFRDSLVEFGLGLGDWKWSLAILTISLPVLAGLGALSALDESVAEIYPLNPHSGDTAGLFAFHLASRFVFYTAWELLFRGLIQRAVAKKAGAPAGIAVQTALSTVAHFSFPLSETIASFFGGLVWGVQAERAKSIWPGVLQHWIIGAALETVIVWA